MIRSCVVNFGGNWYEHLPLVQSMYNNKYHFSIQMAPFEALYGMVVEPQPAGLRLEKNR